MPRYLLDTTTNEIHDLCNLRDGCKIEKLTNNQKNIQTF